MTAPSPTVKSRHAHLYMPIVASQFPKEYPFVEQRNVIQNTNTLKQNSTSGGKYNQFVSESGQFCIPPAPAAPVALVPVIFFFF